MCWAFVYISVFNYCIVFDCFVSSFENQNQISATFPLEKGFV